MAAIRAVAHCRHQAPILAVRPDADIRAVSLGQDIEHRRQIHIQPQPSQFFGLDLALLPGIVDVSGRAHRQIVREHGNAVPEHDDPPAFMVGRHQQFAAERLFQIGNQFFKLRAASQN